MRPFYIYKSKHGIYYVQFTDERTQVRLSARSTGQRSYTDALRVACAWLRDGVPEKGRARPVDDVATVKAFLGLLENGKIVSSELERIAGSLSRLGVGVTVSGDSVGTDFQVPVVESTKTLLVPFLDSFWTYETSPYVQDKVIHKQRIGRQHCHTSRQRVSHWCEYFTESKYLEDVTTSDLKGFERFLAEKGLSAASLNHILIVGKTAFKWAVANGKLSADPSSGLTRYGKDTKARDILSDEEVKAILSVKWEDERARVASLVAMTCGLRAGEILGLQVCDIGENRLHVRHSWSTFEGLKSTKNGKERVVPLLPFVRLEVLRLARSNPFGWDPERFVFYGNLPDRPVVINVIHDAFKKALARIGISESLRKERNIVFHSWRHYYAKVVADRVDQRKAQLALGHITAAMTEHYANHRTEGDLLAVELALGNAFSSVLSG